MALRSLGFTWLVSVEATRAARVVAVTKAAPIKAAATSNRLADEVAAAVALVAVAAVLVVAAAAGPITAAVVVIGAASNGGGRVGVARGVGVAAGMGVLVARASRQRFPNGSLLSRDTQARCHA